jgi:hypothetical protein
MAAGTHRFLGALRLTRWEHFGGERKADREAVLLAVAQVSLDFDGDLEAPAAGRLLAGPRTVVLLRVRGRRVWRDGGRKDENQP